MRGRTSIPIVVLFKVERNILKAWIEQSYPDEPANSAPYILSYIVVH